MTKIKVYDIQWFYNYEEFLDEMTQEEYDEQFNSEPTEMIVDVTDWGVDENDIEEIEDYLSDYISDESGYYHEGFSWNWI